MDLQEPPPDTTTINTAQNVRDHPDNRNIKTSEDETGSSAERILVFLSMAIFVITFPISIWSSLVVVKEYQRAVIFRLGRLKKGGARGPGIFFILPCIDEFIKVDLRTTLFNILPQEVLTKDSVTVQMDAVVFYRIRDPLKAVIQVAHVHDATQLLAQTTLRNVTGSKKLMEFLSDKEGASYEIEQVLDEGTHPWGVKVERVEIRDVRLPVSLQRAMAAEAEAAREAKGKFVAAEGELNASRALKEASDVMSKNPMTLQLRYLQTLSMISTEQQTTIIFPFPIELMLDAASSTPRPKPQARPQPASPPAPNPDVNRDQVFERQPSWRSWHTNH